MCSIFIIIVVVIAVLLIKELNQYDPAETDLQHWTLHYGLSTGIIFTILAAALTMA